MVATTTQRTGLAGRIDNYFSITARGSTFAREIRGGLTTFFAMAYIVVLNPIILGNVQDGQGNFLGGVGSPEEAIPLIAAATALVAGVLTITMGLWARFPMAIAAGLGINAFLAFNIAAYVGMSWPQAMGFVVIEGVLMLILVLTKFRQAVFKAVPKFLKQAIAVGIGLFLAFIGLNNAGIVSQGEGTPTQFADGGSITTLPMVVFIVGLFTAVVLLVRKVRGALLISIIAATVLALVIEAVAKLGPSYANPAGWALVVPTFEGTTLSLPDLGLIGQVDLFGGFTVMPILTAVLLIFSLLIMDFFDTMGTMTAVGSGADLLDEDGTPQRAQEILIVDSLGAVGGGFGSVSSNTSFIESTAGVGDGARTGLASVVTGTALLLSTFLTPLFDVVPSEAATPVLVVVGLMMVSQVAGIDWKDYRVAFPAFITFIMMPFGFSISVGIGAGFISYVLLQVVSGGARKVHPLMWITATAFVVYFALGPIQAALS